MRRGTQPPARPTRCAHRRRSRRSRGRRAAQRGGAPGRPSRVRFLRPPPRPRPRPIVPGFDATRIHSSLDLHRLDRVWPLRVQRYLLLTSAARASSGYRPEPPDFPRLVCCLPADRFRRRLPPSMLKPLVLAAAVAMFACTSAPRGGQSPPAPPACALPEADQAWLDRALEAWRFTSREITGIGRGPHFQAIVFSAD